MVVSNGALPMVVSKSRASTWVNADRAGHGADTRGLVLFELFRSDEAVELWLRAEVQEEADLESRRF